MTGIPASAYSIASGSPTYPRPMTAAVKFLRFSRAWRSPRESTSAIECLLEKKGIVPDIRPARARGGPSIPLSAGSRPDLQADFSFLISATSSGTALKRSPTSP